MRKMERITMKILIAAVVSVWLTASLPAQSTDSAAPARLAATVNIQQTKDPVSKYEYGMFIEHIRDTMYRSLWAEMLDDRKFSAPIVSVDPAPARPQPQGGGGRATQ